MSRRPVPVYETTGLPVPPRKRDCVGESCPVAFTRGSCFTDEHHLFFSEKMYTNKGGVYLELFKDVHARIRMARCRHNSGYAQAWHSMYDYTPFPKKEVAGRFVEESAILQQLGVHVDNMASIIDRLTTDNPKRAIINVPSAIEWLEIHNEEFNSLVPRLDEIEVMPGRISAAAIERLNVKRKSLSIGDFIRMPEVPGLSTDSLQTPAVAAAA